jgi:hypothetical protein
MGRISAFNLFSLASIGAAAFIIGKAARTERTFFDMVIYITSSKLNLVIFLICLVTLLTNAANLMILIFFG